MFLQFMLGLLISAFLSYQCPTVVKATRAVIVSGHIPKRALITARRYHVGSMSIPRLKHRLYSTSHLSGSGDLPISREETESRKKKGKVVESGHVYYVATPLGNLADITVRAQQVLTEVDYICAEDTRQTIKLLRHLSIPHKQLISHHDHNLASSIPRIISLVQAGHSIAVVSDAGTPGISDPGTELAAALSRTRSTRSTSTRTVDNHSRDPTSGSITCDDNTTPVENWSASASAVPVQVPVLHPVPGPSAVAAALSICGFPCTPFTFMGFLPARGRGRADAIRDIQRTFSRHTVVLYEAPHRIERTLTDLMTAPVAPDDQDAATTDIHTHTHTHTRTSSAGRKTKTTGAASVDDLSLPPDAAAAAAAAAAAVTISPSLSSSTGTGAGTSYRRRRLQERPCVCCRELTKLHEQISRGSVQQVLQSIQRESSPSSSCSDSASSNSEEGEVIRAKGEFTIVLGPVPVSTSAAAGRKQKRNVFNREWDIDINPDNLLNKDTISSGAGAASGDASASGGGGGGGGGDVYNEAEAEEDVVAVAALRTLKQLQADGVRRSEAVKLCAQMLSLPRGAIYAMALDTQHFPDW